MARPRLLDLMQAFPFWVFDVSGNQGSTLFSVFDPTLGFSAVTAPEISVETRDIQPGNWEYKRRVVKGAEAGSITLSRGARFYDSDFYNWITNAILGRQPVRRNLVLVHFMGLRAPSQAIALAQGHGNNANLSFPDNGAAQLATRTPGRAWVLYDCLPIRYRAGSDFDASSSDVSIQELEVQPEHVIELTLATLSPVAARGIGAGISIASAV